MKRGSLLNGKSTGRLKKMSCRRKARFLRWLNGAEKSIKMYYNQIQCSNELNVSRKSRFTGSYKEKGQLKKEHLTEINCKPVFEKHYLQCPTWSK